MEFIAKLLIFILFAIGLGILFLIGAVFGAAGVWFVMLLIGGGIAIKKFL